MTFECKTVCILSHKMFPNKIDSSLNRNNLKISRQFNLINPQSTKLKVHKNRTIQYLLPVKY